MREYRTQKTNTKQRKKRLYMNMHLDACKSKIWNASNVNSTFSNRWGELVVHFLPFSAPIAVDCNSWQQNWTIQNAVDQWIATLNVWNWKHAWELGVYSLRITSLVFFLGGRKIFYLFFPLPKPRAWSWESVLNAKGSRANHQHQPFFAVFTYALGTGMLNNSGGFWLSSNNWTFGKSTLMHPVSRVLVGKQQWYPHPKL